MSIIRDFVDFVVGYYPRKSSVQTKRAITERLDEMHRPFRANWCPTCGRRTCAGSDRKTRCEELQRRDAP